MDLQSITPGVPVVGVISALPGGNAERIVRLIGNPPANFNSQRYPRHFPEWQGNVCEGVVEVAASKIEIPLTLKLGEEEGLVLRDAPGVSSPLKTNGALMLHIGSEFPEKRLLWLAHNIVAYYVVHGRNWKTRNGVLCPEPFGPPSPLPRMPKVPKPRRKKIGGDIWR